MLGKQGLMEQCGHAITYLSYDSLKRRGERERKRERRRVQERDGSNSCRNWHTQGNKCYFVPVQRWRSDGMVFHSLKNQTFGGGQRYSAGEKEEGLWLNGGGKTHQDIATVQVKKWAQRDWKREERGHFNHVLIMWSEWNRPGRTLNFEICHVYFGGKQGFQSAGRSRMLSNLGSRFAAVVLLVKLWQNQAVWLKLALVFHLPRCTSPFKGQPSSLLHICSPIIICSFLIFISFYYFVAILAASRQSRPKQLLKRTISLQPFIFIGTSSVLVCKFTSHSGNDVMH